MGDFYIWYVSHLSKLRLYSVPWQLEEVPQARVRIIQAALVKY